MIDRYLRDLIRVIGVGAAFASLPVLASLAELQPPWPPAIGQVSGALVLISALVAWEFVRGGTVLRRRRWVVSAVALTLVGLLSYLAILSQFVVTMPITEERIITGFTCSADAAAIYREYCPFLSIDALNDAEWSAEKLWTRGSITVVRLGLAGTWLLFTAGLICSVGSIVAGRKIRRKK